MTNAPPAAVPAPILERFLHTLDASSVRWCLLRPAATLGHGGDIDLLVDSDALADVCEVFAGAGFVRIPIGGADVHAAAFDLDREQLVWLHIQTEVRLGAGRVAADTVLRAVRREPLPCPEDGAMFWIVLLHDLFDKGEVPERHRAELARTAPSALLSSTSLQEIALDRRLDPAMLVTLVQAGDWEQLQAIARRHAGARDTYGSVIAALADRVRGLRTWRGLSVAVMGPDGAGKTTLVSGLSETLPFSTRVIYMGLTGGRLPKADALRVPGLVLAARLALLWIRYGLGVYHRARGRIVLFDRYVLDGRVPSGAVHGSLHGISRRVQAAAVPRPELLLLLDAPGSAMYARKGEYDATRLEQWREAYRRLSGSARAVELIDAEQPPEVVRRAAQARIWRCYVERWQRGH